MTMRPSDAPPFAIEKPSPNITVVRMDVTGPPSEWSQKFILRSDVHRDSTKCRRDIEAKQIRDARDNGWGIIDVGDMFDAMQGPGDKRACKEALRDEHARADYFDSLVDEAVDAYRDAAWNVVGLTLGNHEESVIRHYGTNLTKRVAQGLRRETKAPVHSNGYQGWYVFAVTRNGTCRSRVVMYANHGYGGGGQVTKDLIQGNRMQSYTEADVIASGHTHDLYAVADIALRLNAVYKEQQAMRWLAKCGTCKQTYGTDDTGGMGFEQRQGHRPKPVGHCVLSIGWDSNQDRATVKVTPEAFS